MMAEIGRARSPPEVGVATPAAWQTTERAAAVSAPAPALCGETALPLFRNLFTPACRLRPPRRTKAAQEVTGKEEGFPAGIRWGDLPDGGRLRGLPVSGKSVNSPQIHAKGSGVSSEILRGPVRSSLPALCSRRGGRSPRLTHVLCGGSLPQRVVPHEDFRRTQRPAELVNILFSNVQMV